MREKHENKVWLFVKKKIKQESTLYLFVFLLFLSVVGITVAIEAYISYMTQGHVL